MKIRKIMVVDNDPIILKLVSSFLEKEGYEVRVSRDGLEAVTELNDFHPDVILVDWVMPNIDGEKFCKIIRRKREYDPIFLVVMSATILEEKIDLPALSIDACIAKGPFKKTSEIILKMLRDLEAVGRSKMNGGILGSDNLYQRHITKELLASLRHKDVVLNNISEGILELTAHHTIIYANKSALSLLGLDEHDLICTNLSEILKPDLQLIQSSAIFPDDLERIYLINNKQLHIQILPLPESTDAVAIIQNVTDQLGYEKELLESEKKYSSLFQQSRDWILVHDLQGTIIDANRTALKEAGYHKKELLSRNVKELFRPDGSDLVERNFRELTRTGAVTFEIQTNPRENEPFYAEVTASLIIIGEKQVVHTVLRDISERKKTELALRESEERYRDLFENSTDLIQVVSPEGRFLYVNDAWKKAVQYSDEELEKLTIFDLIRKDYQEHCLCKFKEVLQGKRLDSIEVAFLAKDGREILLEGNVNCRIHEGKPVSTRGLFRDITERKELEDKLHRLSITDELTGLLNRRGFLTMAEQQLQIAARNRNTILLFFLDLDDFKAINDRFGHKEGDRVLAEMAAILKANFRQADIIGRLGGDEFAVLQTQLEDAAEVEVSRRRLHENIARFNAGSNRDYTLAVSIGLAISSRQEPVSLEELMLRADRLMYTEKKRKHKCGSFDLNQKTAN